MHAGWGGFTGSPQDLVVSLVAKRAAPFQVAHGPVEGTGQPYTVSWTSQSAEPYKEKAFESQSQTWSSREGSRTAGLCPRRDEEFRGKVGKHVPCVPKGLSWSLHIQPGLKGIFQPCTLMTLTLYPLLASAILEGVQYLKSYEKTPISSLGENAAVKNLKSL